MMFCPTVGARFDRRTAAAVSFCLCLVCLTGLMSGCARRVGVPSVEAMRMTQEEREQADRLYRLLSNEHALGGNRQAIGLADSLLAHYPAYPRNDEVAFLAADASRRLGDDQGAERFLRSLLDSHPGSAFRADALSLGANLSEARGETSVAADYLVRLHDLQQDKAARESVRVRAAPLLESLADAQLIELARRYPDSSLHPYLEFLRMQQLLAAGQQSQAEDIFTALQLAAPASPWTQQAEDFLSHPDQWQTGGRYGRPIGIVSPRTIGLLCPLSERYAVLGNAFHEGVKLAIDRFNRLLAADYVLKVEDTVGEPVKAVLSTRRLVDDEGVIAIIGGMLSSTTTPAAVVTSDRGVPHISPTATDEKIWQIGPFVFQTNLTEQYEVRLLAYLATEVLLKERLAVLHPDSPEGERLRQIFTDEIQDRGGNLIASVSFGAETTDFRAPLRQLKAARPEVVFIPATVDQMILLGPQLDFFHASVLVLGLSNWDSPRLLREVGPIMERAVFPSETAMFPRTWQENFAKDWKPGHMPADATPIALKAYQATSLLLDTLWQDGCQTRGELAESLRQRLNAQRQGGISAQTLGQSLRMISDGKSAPFPIELYTDTWRQTPSEFGSTYGDTLRSDGSGGADSGGTVQP